MPVGENAVKDGQDDARRGIRKKSMAESQGGSQEMEMDEDESTQATQSQPRRKEKKKVRIVGLGNEEDDDAPRRSQRRSRR